MRITKKYLTEWVNQRLKADGFPNYKVVDIYHTRYRSHEYENGAYKTSIVLEPYHHIWSHFSLGDLEMYVRKGLSMYIIYHNKIGDWELDIASPGRERPNMLNFVTGRKNLRATFFGDGPHRPAEPDTLPVVEATIQRMTSLEKATQLIGEYLTHVDAFTGGRERHTPVFVKRLVTLLLAEMIAVVEPYDATLVSYYQEVQQHVDGYQIK